MSKIYAGIGSRKLTQEEWDLCYKTGRWLASQGWTLRTGAAQGADQAFAEGAISVDGNIVLCLPWPSYEFKWVEPMLGRGARREVLMYPEYSTNTQVYYDSVKEFHPAPDRLSPAMVKLHARNALILDCVGFVIAWPKHGPRGGLGGTGQGIRIAAGWGIKTIRLDEPLDYKRVTDKVGL